MKIYRNCLLVIFLLVAALWFLAPYIDQYDPSGEVVISGLSAPVRIVRDDKGVPYVHAETFEDVIAGQGFVTAQDRMFQLEMMRSLAHGRLSELIGEKGVATDTLVHLIDVPAQANRQLKVLAAEDRDLLQSYLLGINGYLSQRADEITLPLRSKPPKPWTLEELVAVQIFNSWGSTVNWRQELLSQSLIDHLGVEQAADISQITINADNETEARKASDYNYQNDDLQLSYTLDSFMPAPDAVGSNCWVTGSSRSAGGMPIVASDPHVDARRLPGFWHPIGLITPNWRAVGGAVASGPGIGIGRTDSIAWGITNGYGDMVDLYVESQDPDNADNYLEGDESIPFRKRRVELKIKDGDAADGFRTKSLLIRETSRGPIISDHGISIASGKMLSLRWSVPEFYGEILTMRRLMLAKSTDEAISAIGNGATPLTYVVADYEGNIARTGAGFIPLRKRGDGAAPIPVIDTNDSW